MDLAVATEEAAARVLDYFNGFHDGFVQRLTLVSHDAFPARGEQQCAGPFDLEITFAHYNYRDGQAPADQRVEARFRGVTDLRADLTGQPTDWSISTLAIARGTRPVPGGGDEACLVATLSQHRLVDGQRWARHPDLVFAFRQAVFREEPSP